MGGRLKREGTYVYLWLIHVVWQKPTQRCKAIILPSKKKAAVPNLFGMGDQYCGRQFFHGLGGGRMVSRWFKCIAFIMHCICNLMLPLIWQKVLVHNPEVGDPCFKKIIKLKWDHWVVVGYSNLTESLRRRVVHTETLEFLKHRGEHSEHVAICKPRREASKETKPINTWPWTLSLRNCEKTHFHCLGHCHKLILSPFQDR